ncbi:nucleotide pyrophosphohydrolase [Mycoplasmatota bacterium WC44]
MKDMIKNIIDFRDERNWGSHDTPSNLAKSIIIEAAELLENFQWSDDPEDLENVKEELADILIYSIAMVHDLGLDFEEIIYEKLKKNAIKYPVTKGE